MVDGLVCDCFTAIDESIYAFVGWKAVAWGVNVGADTFYCMVILDEEGVAADPIIYDPPLFEIC